MAYLAAKDAGPAGLSGGRPLASLEVQVLEAGHTVQVVRRRMEVIIDRHRHREQVSLAVARRQVTAWPRNSLGLGRSHQRGTGAAAITEETPD